MSEWISVEDRLPKNFEEVLIWPRPEFMYELLTGEYQGGIWTADYEDSYQSYTERVTVTHWQPLPGPPN